MDESVTPTTVYNLLDEQEREAVDDYVRYAVSEQHRLRERVLLAIKKPIPSEYIRRSKNALYKPLLRAAIAERIKEEADKQDISPDRVIQELATIAFAKPTDFLQSTGFGEVQLKDLNTVSDKKLGAVKSIETTPTQFGMRCKVVLQDKLPALKGLAELMGLVAPDKPPALREYVAPLIDEKDTVTIEVGKRYEMLLEDLNKK